MKLRRSGLIQWGFIILIDAAARRIRNGLHLDRDAVAHAAQRPRSCSGPSTLRNERKNRTKRMTARRMISWLVVKHLKAFRFSTRAGVDGIHAALELSSSDNTLWIAHS